MALAGTVMFAVNGTVLKVTLASGLGVIRLTEARAAGAFLGLGVVLLALRPRSLRVRPRELPVLALFGICGLAFAQWFYLLALERLEIGIALLLTYLSPLLVALGARFVFREVVRPRIWAALALALLGLSLVVDVWGGISLDGLGVTFALAGAVAFALQILFADHAVERRDPLSLSCYGFLFAALFWSVLRPWWSFPAAVVDDRVSLLGHLADRRVPVWGLLAWVIVLGSIVPFALFLGSLRHLPATRVAIVAMIEPVVASVVAFAWLGETLSPLELGGGAVVLAAIALAQTAR